MRIRWADLSLAVAALFAATVARLLLDPWLVNQLPYAGYFIAVAFIAWLTTTPIAVASAAFGWLAADFFFIPPRLSLGLEGTDRIVASLAYAAVVGTMLLIAHRMRRAQQKALRNERHLELVSNAVPALISYIDSDRRYVTCNDEYTRWFELPREQVIGRTVQEVVGDRAWLAIGPKLDAAFEGRFVEYEAESIYSRGRKRWIHVAYTPHLDESGRTLGVIALVTDVSERKRAEQSAVLLADIGKTLAQRGSIEAGARAVTERLVAHLGLSRCLLAEIGEDGHTLEIFHQQSASPEPSQVGLYRISDFLTDAERATLAEGAALVIDDVGRDRAPEAAARFRALGIGAVVSAPYVTNGVRRFTLAAEKSEPYAWRTDEVQLLREVSARVYLHLDRARGARTLRESEQRYRSLVSVITDIPMAVDPAGRFARPQDAWARYTGQTWERSRGFGWLDAVHPDDRKHTREQWAEVARSRGLYDIRARVWRAATREFRYVVARATPVLDERGTVREWVGACTDIHDETMQAQALIEADRRKDEFLATLAHELRNPLAPIRNGLYILKLEGKAEGAVANIYQMLERQVKHLVRLVDDLMEVSRITRGRVELRKEKTDVQAIIQSAIETSRPLVDEAGHKLEVSLPAEPVRLEADPVRLAQVVTNLLNNAAKYTDRGGRIRVAARCEGSGVEISVRDSGRGIPAPMLSRVFDLFTQTGDGLTRSQGGLGIGLTLVRSLVEMHGGTVEARSQGPGRGSEFIVHLPAADAIGGAPEKLASGERDSLPSRRILIVDDNRDAAESLGVLLTLLGVETRTAQDGRAALEALDEFQPSVVILDLGMPGMDGHEVAERMRQHPHGRHVTIVALTGWGQERDRQRSLEAGIDHHVVKPIDFEVLRGLLASLPQAPRVGQAAG